MNDKLKILIEYQGWRRGDEAVMLHSAIIGEASDCTAADVAETGKPKPGDLPPVGYLAWHEWAAAQHKAGFRQVQCSCGLWLFPQEVCKHGK